MLFNVKSKYILESLFSTLNEIHKLYIIKYNNKLKNILGIDLDYYKNKSGKYKIKQENGIVEEYTLNSKVLVFKGYYLNERRHGLGKEYHYNGKIEFEGEFLDGQKNGLGKLFYNSGELKFKGNYINGEKNGKGEEYYDFGQIKFKGEFLHDKKWNGYGYDPTGNIRYIIKCGEGTIKEFYNSGILKLEGEYSNGEISGLVKEYFMNGELQFDGKYLKGKRNGIGKEYDIEKKLIYEGEYLEGEPKQNEIDENCIHQ